MKRIIDIMPSTSIIFELSLKNIVRDIYSVNIKDKIQNIKEDNKAGVNNETWRYTDLYICDSVE